MNIRVWSFAVLATLSLNVYAEYYLVDPERQPVICIYGCGAKPHVVKQKKKIASSCHHRVTPKKKSNYSISVHYVQKKNPCAVTSCQQSVWHKRGCRAYHFVEFYSGPYPYYKKAKVIDKYDAGKDFDMSTADDDASVHPDMQINND